MKMEGFFFSPLFFFLHFSLLSSFSSPLFLSLPLLLPTQHYPAFLCFLLRNQQLISLFPWQPKRPDTLSTSHPVGEPPACHLISANDSFHWGFVSGEWSRLRKARWEWIKQKITAEVARSTQEQWNPPAPSDLAALLPALGFLLPAASFSLPEDSLGFLISTQDTPPLS